MADDLCPAQHEVLPSVGDGQAATGLLRARLLALLGALQLALPCALTVVAARRLSPTEVALIGLTENVFGPLWAWLGAGEVPGGHALFGGALVLAALVMQALAAGSGRARPT